MNAKGFFLFSGLVWLFCSCNLPSKLKKQGEMKMYLALGDSYTIGESVSENSRFPNELVSQLNNQKNTFQPAEIIARTGWRTDQLLEAIQSKSTLHQYDLVTLLIGVNNEFQGESIKQYEEDFRTLCTKAIGLAKKKENVFILSIPDYGYTPYGKNRQSAISKRIDLFNASNKRLSDSLGLNYVNITPISREGFIRPNLVAHDGLHPSGDQYKEWVEALRKSMEESK